MEHELKIKRKYYKPTYTIGYWFTDGAQRWNSLEDKDRGLTQDMPTSEIYKKKCYGQTAIPKGRYEVRLSYSQKFAGRNWAAKYGNLVPEVLDVPGFSGIRIHPGQDANSTLGCPLVGWNTAKGRLTDSQKCYFELMDGFFMPAHAKNEKIWLTIE